jgi:arylsulfatase A-like enzyme
MSEHISRRSFLRKAGLGAVALTLAGRAGASARAAASGARPNILFIYSDDHAYQSISAYGSRINQTPHLDRIGREGMKFNECYVTNSICGPMRAVVVTGKYSHLNGMLTNGHEFDVSQQTFPKLLQKAGYQTALVGKYHLGDRLEPQGFDYWEVLIGQGPYYNPRMRKGGQAQPVPHTGYTTDIIADLALEWLKNGRDKAKPFLLMCQNKAPHRSWEPSPKYFNLYEDVTIPEPASLFESYDGRPKSVQQQDMTIAKTMNDGDVKLKAPGDLNPEQRQAWDAFYEPRNKVFREANLAGQDLVRWKYQRYIKDYLRCIASVDENVGRLLQYLDDSGLAANTVVIYASDQGFYLGEHGWFDKRWIYEESLRTPFLIRWPGVIKPGSVNGDIVSPLDFAETFLDVAGAPVPPDMQGRSFVPLLEGHTPPDWRKTFYYHYYEHPAVHNVHRHCGVADGRYKLIHFYEPDVDEWELIDLKANPGENRNFYNDPKYADVQARLLAELKRLRQLYQVPDQDPLKPPPAKKR